MGKQNKRRKASWTLYSRLLSLLGDCDPEKGFSEQNLSRRERKEGSPLPILDPVLGGKLFCHCFMVHIDLTSRNSDLETQMSGQMDEEL